jgi:hypothetical protein
VGVPEGFPWMWTIAGAVVRRVCRHTGSAPPEKRPRRSFAETWRALKACVVGILGRL